MKLNISIDDVSPHPRSSTKVLERCFELIDCFSDIKFTLFVPVAYHRTMGPTSNPYPLWINKENDFIEELKRLPKENFEICYHGLFHGVRYKSNNDEFQHLNILDAENKVYKMLVVTEQLMNNEIPFKRIFRPPAWKISEDAKTVLKRENFKLALQDSVTGNPPFMDLQVCEKNEIVYHACEWDRNYLSKQMSEDLRAFLRNNECEFVFIEELL